MVVNTQSHIGVSIFVILGLLGLFLPHQAYSDLIDAEKAEELARKTFAEKYLEFTSDKNVMGKATSVDGKVQQTGSKNRFDNDDGVSYKSDLTYHDFAFTTPDDVNNKQNQNNNDPKGKKSPRDLQPFVSPHGGISEGGGSSILERTMYQEFDKYKKQEDQNPPNREEEEKKGLKYRGVYKITTKEIFEDPKTKQVQAGQSSQNNSSSNNNQDSKKKEKDKVERLELREDTKQAIEKIGTDSAETIIQAARDKDLREDPNALPNELLIYDAAAKATNSLWNSALANLSQRRIFKGLSGDSDYFDPPKLSEEQPDCASWEKSQQEKLAKVNPQERQERQKEFDLMKKGCEQMSKMGYSAVNPGYEVDPNNSKVEVLKERGPEKEDAFARDTRVQLELMSAAGKKISDIKTNWQYEEKDEQVKLKNYNNEEVDQTMAEQLDSYNKKLEEAAAAYQEIQSQDADTFKSQVDPTQYQIQPGTKSLVEINQRPTQGFSDFGVDASKLGESTPAQNYEQLIKNVK